MDPESEVMTLHPKIGRVFSAAHDRAAKALHQWSDENIELELRGLLHVPMESVADALNINDEISTMVVLLLEGELNGEFVLTFDFEGAKRVASVLLNEKVNYEPEMTSWEIAALNETGNIVCCAYLNEITNLIGEELIPGPPHFIRDFGRSVIQQALMSQAMLSDQVMISNTCFHSRLFDITGSVLFVPGPCLLKAVESKCFSVDKAGG